MASTVAFQASSEGSSPSARKFLALIGPKVPSLKYHIAAFSLADAAFESLTILRFKYFIK